MSLWCGHALWQPEAHGVAAVQLGWKPDLLPDHKLVVARACYGAALEELQSDLVRHDLVPFCRTARHHRRRVNLHDPAGIKSGHLVHQDVGPRRLYRVSVLPDNRYSVP